MANMQIFKGGYDHDHENRIAIAQRPADGHIKPAEFEDFIRIGPKTMGCAEEWRNLEVGDVIGIHTTLTFGLITGLGFRVVTPQEGLTFGVVFSDNPTSIQDILVSTYLPNEDRCGPYVEDEVNIPMDQINDIGSVEKFYAGYVSGGMFLRTNNTFQVGLQVLTLPTEGLTEDFLIESRLHFKTTVRPPASNCCPCD